MPVKQHRMKEELSLNKHPKNMTTEFRSKFTDPTHCKYNSNIIKFENKAKLNNIDPFKGKLKAPCAKETKN